MPTKPARTALTPEAELRTFLTRFDPAVQKLFRAVRTALRKRFPTVNELAYEYPDSVVIGYSPTERGIQAIVALAARADGVLLHLSNGPQLPDPKRLLRGSGKMTRYIALDSAARLGSRDVKALIAAATERASVPAATSGKGKLIIQSSAAKRGTRRKSSR